MGSLVLVVAGRPTASTTTVAAAATAVTATSTATAASAIVAIVMAIRLPVALRLLGVSSARLHGLAGSLGR